MKSATEQKQGHVYLLHAVGTDRYKIGMTQQGRMAKRFNELNGAQASHPLENIKVINVSDRHQVEAELHQRFKAFRVHGEWFELDRNDLNRVDKAMAEYEQSAQTTDPFEKFSLLTLLRVFGIFMFISFVWQSYQGDRSRMPSQSIPTKSIGE